MPLSVWETGRRCRKTTEFEEGLQLESGRDGCVFYTRNKSASRDTTCMSNVSFMGDLRVSTRWSLYLHEKEHW